MAGIKKPASKSDAIHLFFGSDEFAVSTHARQMVDRLCPPADQAFGLETIDGAVETVDAAISAVHRTLEAVLTRGFMGGRKVVWFRDLKFLGLLKVAGSADVKSSLEKLLAQMKAGVPEGHVLVLSAPKLDKRSVFYKTMESLAQVMEFNVPEKAYEVDRAAPVLIREQLQQAGLEADEAALRALAERTGADARQIANEVEKLVLYLGERARVTEEDVIAVVPYSRERPSWSFADAIAQRDLPLALRQLRQLLFQGEKPMGIIAFLERRIRELLLYRECLDRNWLTPSGAKQWPSDLDPGLSSLLGAIMKTHPYVVSLRAREAAGFKRAQLVRWSVEALATHEQLVSSPLPGSLLLEMLAIRLIGKKA